jgi:hypothetical protein
MSLTMRHTLLWAIGLVVAAAPIHGQGIVRGTVFIDRNGNGVRDANERALPGVIVSNQDAVVVTDSTGAFEIAAGPNGIVFVSEPDGYRAVGSFWRAVGDSVRSIAFAMRPAPPPRAFAFVYGSDTHIAPASVPQTERFRTIVDSVRPDFVLVAGDLVKDALRVSEAEARSYYELAGREFRSFAAPVRLVPGNHENFGIETALSHVDPANPLFGRAMYHHYFGPDYYSFTRGGVHFVGLNSVDIDGTSYYGHVDSLQLAWLERDLAHVPAHVPVVTFNHIPLVSAFTAMEGITDAPPAPTLITVKGKVLFRHLVSNSGEVLGVLRAHKHVLALGAHIHAGERISFINDGIQTRFEQSPAVIGPSGSAPMTFPSGVIVYTVTDGHIDAGRFVPLSLPTTTPH